MYVDTTEYISYAEASGVDLSEIAESTLLQELYKASQYIDSKEIYLIGSRVERDQNYAFPRKKFNYQWICL